MSTGWLGRHWGMSEGSVVARHEVSKRSFMVSESSSDGAVLVEGTVQIAK